MGNSETHESLSDALLDIENKVRKVRENYGTDEKEKREYAAKILKEIETKLEAKFSFPMNKMYVKAFKQCMNETLVENL